MLVLLGHAAPVRAANPSPTEFPFDFAEGLIWIDVQTSASTEPLTFLLDSGSEVSVVNLNTAKRLHMPLGPAVHVAGVQSSQTGYWPQQFSGKVSGVSLPNIVLALDMSKLDKACKHSVDGLIGADFFKGKIVQIDFDERKVRMLKPDRARKSDDVLPLQTRKCGLRVPITVNDVANQWVRLDTGCATSLQWVTSAVQPGECIDKKVAVGLSEFSIPQTTSTIVIGKNQFEIVPTGLHEIAIFPGEAGLLGNGLLSRYSKVTIDAKAGRLVLQKKT